MFADWTGWLLLSTALLVPIHAKYGDARVLDGAQSHVKRQDPQEGRERWEQLHQEYLRTLPDTLIPGGDCTWDNMRVRREWGDMEPVARKAYIKAMFCLANLPGKTKSPLFPGARSRFDDFTVVHMENIYTIHRSGFLTSFHRDFLNRIETALIEECNYQYAMPYWLPAKYLGTPLETWPVFDNSDTSLSGNGTQTGPLCACIMEGPMKDWVVTLGPRGFGENWGCSKNPDPFGRGWNPRCLERVFDESALESLHYKDIVMLIDGAPDLSKFASYLELEWPSVHNEPHRFLGALQSDVAFSSQDTMFNLHHGGVDCLWAVWQSRDWDRRTNELPDPHIFDSIREEGIISGFYVPTPDPTMDTEIPLSPVFRNITIREAQWPTRNGFCYRCE